MIRRHPLAVLILVLVVVAAAIELPNYLRKPSLRTFEFSSEDCQVLVFVDQAPSRQTGIFFSKDETPVTLDVLNGAGNSIGGKPFGSLRWSSDRTALVAVELAEGGIETGQPIWVFDTIATALIAQDRIGLNRAVESRGGLGDRIFSWYEIGEPGSYQFTWQAERWREMVEAELKVEDPVF